MHSAPLDRQIELPSGKAPQVAPFWQEQLAEGPQLMTAPGLPWHAHPKEQVQLAPLLQRSGGPTGRLCKRRCGPVVGWQGVSEHKLQLLSHAVQLEPPKQLAVAPTWK